MEDETKPRLLEAGVILIATGSTPHRASTIPFAGPGVYDSDTIQHMERLPRSLAIAGGGTIGCEYACLFKVLGLDEVRVINSGARILPFADSEISTMLFPAEALTVLARIMWRRTFCSTHVCCLHSGGDHHGEPLSNPTNLGPAAAGKRRRDQFTATRRRRVSSGLVPMRTGGPHVPVPALT